MRLLVLLFALIATHATLRAQDAAPVTVGLDVMPFFSRLMGHGLNSAAPVQVLIRKQIAPDVNRRTGFAGSLSLDLNEANASADLLFAFTSGKERFYDFERRWRAAWGWEFRSSLALFVSENPRVRVAAGAAPVASIQYRINDRLSLATEASFPVLVAFNVSNDNPSVGLSAQMGWPTMLWLQYRLK